MIAERISLQAAADRVGVSRQAVHRAWRRLRGDDLLPASVLRQDFISEIRRLAASGMPAEGVAGALGIDYQLLRVLARRHEIRLGSRAELAAELGRDRLSRAVALVLGGATLGEACKAHHVKYSTLARAMRRRGVRARREGWGRVIDGRGARAAAAVRAGVATAAQAALREGCAYWTVLRRLARPARPDDELIGIAAVAELAGVSPSVVEFWRGREANFPAPIADVAGASAFLRGEILRWLRGRIRR